MKDTRIKNAISDIRTQLHYIEGTLEFQDDKMAVVLETFRDTVRLVIVQPKSS